MQLAECSACDHHLSGDAIQITFPDSFQRPLSHGSQTAERRGKSDVGALHARPANRPCKRRDRFRAEPEVSRGWLPGSSPGVLLQMSVVLQYSFPPCRLGARGSDRHVSDAVRPQLVIRGSWPPEASPGPSALVPTSRGVSSLFLCVH